MNPIIRIATAMTFAGLSMGAFAQAKNFEGMNVTGSVGYQSATTKLTDVNVVGLTVSDGNPAGAAVNLGLEYIASINDQYTLGLGVDTNLLASNSGELNVTVNGVKVQSGKTKVSNSYSLFVSPGIAVNNETLIYSKLGYVQMTTKTDFDDGGNLPSSALTGYSLGLGFKQLMGKNTFLFGEFNYITLQSKDGASDGNTYKTGGSAMNGAVGIGYKF